jgi:isopenicillin N synthase-like dioxygenase
MDALPVFELEPFLKEGEDISEQTRDTCAKMAEFLRETGVLIVRDPRVSSADNDVFIDMMERYFGQSDNTKAPDARPQYHFQVGVTPAFTELPRCAQEPDCLKKIAAMPEEDRAHPPTGADCKERFFWRMGELPTETEFPALNADPVVPAAFPEWVDVMDTWGNKMLSAVRTVAQMLALGFDLPRTVFTDKMHLGPHLLAPTGTDLGKYNQLGAVYAGYHYDLNFMTIHGKSRFPGLYVWLRNGKKTPVKVPEGCLLLQAGKQIEYLTGGYVAAGYHEVVCNQATLEAIERAKAAGKSTWRVSSTLFSHMASDSFLEPVGKFGEDAEVRAKFPPIKAGHHVQAELDYIKLAKTDKPVIASN